MAGTIIKILQILLVVVGIASVLWGVYDMFGDSGSQSSVGVKKIFGGIAFASLAFFIMDWAGKEIGKAEAEAGISNATGKYVVEQNGEFPEYPLL